MVGRLLDTDPELTYEHAQAAVRRAGRVDVVREAAGLAAYRTELLAEALRELRTVRRLNGSSEHLAIIEELRTCWCWAGRSVRCALAQEPEAETLDAEAQIELAMVVSGARLDLGQPEAAVAALSTEIVRVGTGIIAIHVAQARASALEAAGQADEAVAELAPYTQEQLDEAAGDVEPDEEFVAFDLSEFDAEGEYEDYPVEASGDAGTSELAEAELDHTTTTRTTRSPRRRRSSPPRGDAEDDGEKDEDRRGKPEMTPGAKGAIPGPATAGCPRVLAGHDGHSDDSDERDEGEGGR